MRDIGGDHEDFSCVNGAFGAVVERELQSARKDHGVLLATMEVAGNDGAAEKNQTREGGVIAVEHLARDQRVHFVGLEQFELCGGRHGELLGEICEEESCIETGESSMGGNWRSEDIAT